MIRERALKVTLVVVGFLFVATVYPLVQMHLDETLQMMLSIYVTLGVFPPACVTQPVRESQPDRLRGVVEYCSYRRYDGAVIARCGRTRTSAYRLTCVCCYWCGTDRPRASKA